ncbi:TPA: hypothetical protein LVL66_005838 [Klebsiella oxytoca]|uniref:Uncharacterized protein n=2 Tax=Enterobacteriaceae TaxID=543 RepID=A0A5T9L505_SALER|nr:hypothetical protein [Serratia liquefaciens]EBO0296346.1 hypothetical protein [Salmonella enterica subsp. enterica serovar Alachua]EDT7875596.1 hypothetical protein [Salmonella enterica subsp. enterica serovar Mbandaka]EHN6839168.1 hypothetical protein [Salmonella enterica]HBM3045438.1 hypothetical protein [Klebsiella oxytoca]EHN6848600.1 hypothetical protein [Salmonella enterica]
MLHHCQARSVDDIYLQDIAHIIHPDTAARYLADTALPNRIIPEWDLPQAYSSFVNQYNLFHYQRPWMAYSDALADIKAGKVVLVRKNMTGTPVNGVLTTSGNLRDGLPLSLYSRLRYLIIYQLKRPVYYVHPAAPVQRTQAAKPITSKAAGRLLAAGGIYNGNPEGFRKTAEQLGGDAPAGYAQVMDNKGLLITGASLAAGLTMGRMRFPELEQLEHFGARGTISGRPFDPDKAGGPIENLTTDGVNITHEGIAIVEKHTSRFGDDPGNEFMINRLKKIADGEIPHEQVDLNYYTHECREYQRYCNLGWETGAPADNIEAHELWNNTHTATLEDYKLKGEVEDLYHPDAPLW